MYEFKIWLFKTVAKLVWQENEAELRQALLQGLGKPLVESTGLELSLFKNEIVFMLEKLDDWLSPEEPYVPEAFAGLSPTIHKQPKGICLVIG